MCRSCEWGCGKCWAWLCGLGGSIPQAHTLCSWGLPVSTPPPGAAAPYFLPELSVQRVQKLTFLWGLGWSEVVVVVFSRSAVPDSLRPPVLQSARLLCPWNFSEKNTGVGCHILLQGIFPTQGWNPRLLSPALQAGSLPPSGDESANLC